MSIGSLFCHKRKVSFLEDESEKISEYLNSAFGLHNQSRRAADDREKIRKSVRKAILTARTEIEDVHIEFWQHLERTLKTGEFVKYTPDSNPNWITS